MNQVDWPTGAHERSGIDTTSDATFDTERVDAAVDAAHTNHIANFIGEVQVADCGRFQNDFKLDLQTPDERLPCKRHDAVWSADRATENDSQLKMRESRKAKVPRRVPLGRIDKNKFFFFEIKLNNINY